MKKSPPLLVFYLLEFAASLAFAGIFTISSLYQVTVARLTPLQLVLVGTGLEATVFLFEVPTGVVADMYSRRLSIIIGYIIMGLGFILEGSIPIFWAILAGEMLWGLGYTFTSGATQAWISDEIGEAAAGQAFLRGSQVDNLGSLAGIGLSVALASRAHLNTPILAGGGLLILLALLLVLMMSEHGFKPLPKEERNSWQNMTATFRRGLSMIHLRPGLLTILAIGFFFGMYSEGFDRLWTKHLLEHYTLPVAIHLTTPQWFGLINAVGLLLSIFVTEILRRRIRTEDPRHLVRILAVLSGLIIAGLAIFALGSAFALALITIWIIDIARSLVSPLYTTWVNQRLDSSVRATVLSMSSQVDAIGQIAGGPLVGMVGNFISVPAALGTSSLLLTPVLALFARALKNGKD
jgi:DHA3 family tetracycline resistance protein-like MFS transporter